MYGLTHLVIYSLGAALLYIVAVLGTLDCVSVITYLTAH